MWRLQCGYKSTWIAAWAFAVAASDAASLAMAASFEYGSLAVLRAAARWVSSRADSTRIAMSASLNWIACVNDGVSSSTE